jgi:hypothetical protein
MKVISQYGRWRVLRCGLLATAAIWAASGQTTQINLGTQGRNIDFSNASSTRPAKTGTTLPATCSPGDLFFKSNAPAGQNLYGCSAANTWTMQAGSSGLPDPGSNGLVVRTGQNTTNAVSAPSGAIVGTTDVQTLTNKSIDASEINTGTLSNARMPALSGDVTTTAGNTSTTLATVNSNPGTFGDSTHTLQLTIDGKGRITGVSPISISGGGSGANSLVTGTLNTIPSACTAGALFFATDQEAGQQIYTCSAANTWTQLGSLGSSGALYNANGAIDVNTNIVPRLYSANTWTGLNSFQQGIRMAEQTGCPTPAAGTNCFYNSSLDHLLHRVDSTGSDSVVGATSGPITADFPSVTSGTNTSAAMVVGTGASLATSGTGTIAATSLVDSNQKLALKVNSAASAVDQVAITNAATGGMPVIGASGSDFSIPLFIAAKGTGQLYLNGPSARLDTAGNLTVASCTGCGTAHYLPYFYGKTASGSCGSSTDIVLDTATIPANALKVGDLVEIHALLKSVGGANSSPWFQIGFGNNGGFPSSYTADFLLGSGPTYYTADYKVMVTGQTTQQAFGTYASPSSNQGPWAVIPSDSNGGSRILTIPAEDITASIPVTAKIHSCSGTTNPNSYTVNWTITVTH